MKAMEIAENLHVLEGAVNTGVLVSDGRALLFDCCDTVTPDRLAALGVEHVEMILCTQYRRPNTAGVYPFVENGAKVVAPERERHLMEDPDAHWGDPKNRWCRHTHQRPGPLVPVRPMAVARGIAEGDTIDWREYRIRVLETSGPTEGSVSYVVEVGDKTVAFSGDLIFAPGQVWEFYSLQKTYGDPALLTRIDIATSLQKLIACDLSMAVPSHGDPIGDFPAAATLLIDRLKSCWLKMAEVHEYTYTQDFGRTEQYFGDCKSQPRLMEPAATHPRPWFVRTSWHGWEPWEGECNTFVLVSETGAAFIIDCGNPSGGVSSIAILQDWLRRGVIKSIEGCWVTHYHHDHIMGLPTLCHMGCPIIVSENFADILKHPSRYYLPCVFPAPIPVARVVTDGETWRWREFTMTAYNHGAGQTYYDAGLLVEGHGTSVYFAGDGTSPSGFCECCCGNRNFLRAATGARRCIEIFRKHMPEHIMQMNFGVSWSFTTDQLDYMERVYSEREELWGQVLPWDHPDFGTDEHWVRSYPYEQDAPTGATVCVDIQFTNHGPSAVEAKVEPVLPEGWQWHPERGNTQVEVPGKTDGDVGAWCKNPDKAARIWMTVANAAKPRKHVIPFRITWGERYLGQFRHAIINVR